MSTPGVRGDIRLNIALTQVGTDDLGAPKLPVSIEELLTLAGGTATVDQANILWRDGARSVAASSSENLDLAGVLADAFGATVAAAEIVLIFIRAADTNTNNVILGNVTNGFVGPLGATGTYTIKPGEWFLAVSESGWGVTAATADLLKVANSGAGTPVVYDVLIVGRTVAA